MIKTKGYAAQSAASPLAPYTFERNQLVGSEIQIEVMYCGVCHSDLHSVRNEWKLTHYPIVPGHEIIGRVTELGPKSTIFQVDQIVGVGPMIGSCDSCSSCKQDIPQYCEKEFIEIYNSINKDGTVTQGGFSNIVVIDEKFVFAIPDALLKQDLATLAPLFCAGLTTYSPLKHWNINNKSKVGIVGIGGLGHLAIKIAKALGAYVIAFTSTPWKQKDAKRIGADEVILTCDTESFLKYENSFDFILNVLPIANDLDQYIKLLKIDGALCLIGIPPIYHPPFNTEDLIFGRKHIVGSVIGSPDEMREFLDFCAQHQLVADIELIKPEMINEAFERLLQRNVKYRFVMEIQSL